MAENNFTDFDHDEQVGNNWNTENGQHGSAGGPVGSGNGRPGPGGSGGNPYISVLLYNDTEKRFKPGWIVGSKENGHPQVKYADGGKVYACTKKYTFFDEGESKGLSVCGRWVIGMGEDGNLRPVRAKKAGKAGRERVDDGRPVILITTNEAEVNDEAINALAADLSIYQRNFKLVTIARDHKPKLGFDTRRPEGSPVVRQIEEPNLREALARNIHWTKIVSKNGEETEVDAHPPVWSVQAIFARNGWPTDKIRYLSGIVEIPTLRPDGSVIDEPGYDEQTGLFYAPTCEFPPIPANPTQEDARAAAEELLYVVADFPFKEDHEAAWFSGLLTPMARFLIDGAVPIFMSEANTPGSGKTKTIDVISMIVSGRVMARTAYEHDPVETNKQVVSTCLAGDLLVLYDNVKKGGSFGNSAIEAATTGTTYRGRKLGKNEMPTLDQFCTYYVTGNNISLCGDTHRRIINWRLESPMSNPEERDDFRINKDCPCGCLGNLLAHVSTSRPRLVVAAITVLKAFILAEMPNHRLKPMDFSAWDSLVRNAVYWAIGKDPAVGRKDLDDSDPEQQNEIAFVHGWHELQQADQPGGMTAATMVKRLGEFTADSFTTLRDALAGLFPLTRPGELPSPGSIGMKIQAIKGRNFEELCFRKVTEIKNAAVWKVEPADFL